MNNSSKIDNSANYQDHHLVQSYDRMRNIGREDDFVNETEINLFINSINQTYTNYTPLKILDIGAGTGKLTIPLSKLGHQLTAIDLSSGMLEKLKYKSNMHNLNIEIIKSDLHDFKTNRKWDVVLSSRVLMHVADPAYMISLMTQLSSQLVLFDAPRSHSWNSIQNLLRSTGVSKSTEQYRCFSRKWIVAQLNSSDIKNINITSHFNLPISFHCAIKNKNISLLTERMSFFLSPIRSMWFCEATK